MSQARGRLIYFCAASYIFFFTVLPSARRAIVFVGCAVAFGAAMHLIRNFENTRARHAAFWMLVLSGAIAWAFDRELAQRFDPFTGVLGMLGWGTCALAAASPEVLTDPRPRSRRMRGIALFAAGFLALVVHFVAWFSRGSAETQLLSRALATVCALCLAVTLAAQTRTRRVLASVGVLASAAAVHAVM